MQKHEQVFLGKNGKIFGPYQQCDYDQMLSNGSLTQFTWIWDWKGSTWKLLEMPPPPISDNSEQQERAIPIQAVCFNMKDIMSGKLELITESGCILVAEKGSERLTFAPQSRVELNLYNIQSKKSVTVEASINTIDYKNRRWIYCLRWQQVPNIA